MVEANLCPSCSAPVHFSPGEVQTDCPYCGTQVRLTGAVPEARPSAPALAESLALQAGANVIPLIAAGSPVPLACEETFSTSSDDQDVLHVNLIARRDGTPDRALAAVAFAIAKRGLRGVPQVRMRITVDASGAARLALHEPGTDHRELVPLGVLAVRMPA